jgi:hypothetical protein
VGIRRGPTIHTGLAGAGCGMTAAAPLPLILPNLAEPWYAKPFRFANLPKAAEKVWACLRFEAFRRRSNTITITDRFGAQWCSAHLGIHVGRRCFQKGLKQLEDLGAIVRHRQKGGRQITITVQLAGPKPKNKNKAKAKAPAAKATPSAPAPTAKAQPDEPPPSPEELRQAAADLRAFLAQTRAQEQQQATETTAQAEPKPHPTADTTRRPRLHVPEAIRREIEDKERRRRAAELARLRDIPEDRRTDDQERRIRNLADPGTPTAPSGP